MSDVPTFNESEAPGYLRLFVAVELPDGAKAELEVAQKRVRSLAPADAVKWVAAGGIHLTLKFLGSVLTSRVSAIDAALAVAAGKARACEVALADMGVFPNPRRPRVLWMGLSGNLEHLTAMQREVEEALAIAGFEREQRAFTPHLTLGRVRDTVLPAQAAAVGESVMSVQAPPPVVVPVRSFSLMRSELRREGARYTKMREFALPK